MSDMQILGFQFGFGSPSQVAFDSPFSNSHGWTGSSMEWRLMRANLLKCKLIYPH